MLDGLDIVDSSIYEYDPRLTSDGQGGAIITWVDYRNSPDDHIYAQRVDSYGNLLW